jgi:hypothetical protein
MQHTNQTAAPLVVSCSSSLLPEFRRRLSGTGQTESIKILGVLNMAQTEKGILYRLILYIADEGGSL